MLDIAQIHKHFGATQALRGVSMHVEAGKVHGLLGENGAGKSTLMNVAYGLLRADCGRVTMAGRDVKAGSPACARAAGIGMVHQHFKLVPTLTVAENVILATGRGVGLLPQNLWHNFQHTANMLGWTVDPARKVGSLSVGEQQRVEIVKALAGIGEIHHGVLILDEPTAVLTPAEAADLMRAMIALAARGAGVVFISHKLGEVIEVCDEVTILRRGEKVYAGPVQTAPAMAKLMVGEAAPTGPSQTLPSYTLGSALLEIGDLTAGAILRSASLRVRAGEIVGVAGVDGNGQGDLVGAIVGTTQAASGTVTIAGENVNTQSVRRRVQRIAYIPEDRREQALALNLSVMENLVLKEYRAQPMSGWGFLRPRAWRRRATELAARFDVRCTSIADRVGMLSGGNQQKVVLARELGSGQSVVVAVNPTRGLDVGATDFVMRELLAVRSRGAAVLLVHSDLDELLAVSDRVYVIYNGRIRESADKSKESIGRMMLGGEGPSP